jgi:cysteine sulfinate desulfinase/cysteine desulfurase-like protein
MGVAGERARGSLRLTLGVETTDGDVEGAARIVTCAVQQLRAAPAN